MFKEGQTNIDDEERTGQPSVVSDDFVQSVDQKICERRCFTLSELSCEFPQISHTIRDYQLGLAITSFVQDRFQKCPCM
jgi:hypothetical protein